MYITFFLLQLLHDCTTFISVQRFIHSQLPGSQGFPLPLTVQSKSTPIECTTISAYYSYLWNFQVCITSEMIHLTLELDDLQFFPGPLLETEVTLAWFLIARFAIADPTQPLPPRISTLFPLRFASIDKSKFQYYSMASNQIKAQTDGDNLLVSNSCGSVLWQNIIPVPNEQHIKQHVRINPLSIEIYEDGWIGQRPLDREATVTLFSHRKLKGQAGIQPNKKKFRLLRLNDHQITIKVQHFSKYDFTNLVDQANQDNQPASILLSALHRPRMHIQEAASQYPLSQLVNRKLQELGYFKQQKQQTRHLDLVNLYSVWTSKETFQTNLKIKKIVDKSLIQLEKDPEKCTSCRLSSSLIQRLTAITAGVSSSQLIDLQAESIKQNANLGWMIKLLKGQKSSKGTMFQLIEEKKQEVPIYLVALFLSNADILKKAINNLYHSCYYCLSKLFRALQRSSSHEKSVIVLEIMLEKSKNVLDLIDILSKPLNSLPELRRQYMLQKLINQNIDLIQRQPKISRESNAYLLFLHYSIQQLYGCGHLKLAIKKCCEEVLGLDVQFYNKIAYQFIITNLKDFKSANFQRAYKILCKTNKKKPSAVGQLVQNSLELRITPGLEKLPLLVQTVTAMNNHELKKNVSDLLMLVLQDRILQGRREQWLSNQPWLRELKKVGGQKQQGRRLMLQLLPAFC